MHVVFGFLLLNVCRISQNNADCKDFYMNWRRANWRRSGRTNEVSGNWRRQHRTWTQQTCLHIFGCSISNVNRQARNTQSKHTHTNTLVNTRTLTRRHLLVCACVVLGFGCWHFSVAAFALTLPLSSQTSYPRFFSCSLQFPFSFLYFLLLFFCIFVAAFFALFMLLSLHFTAIALAFKHKNLLQFFVLGLTKICLGIYEGLFCQ